MSHRFMMTVATAALIAGAGFANAQGTGGREGAGGAMQQSAPPAGAAGREGEAGTKASQSEPKGGAANRNAHDMKSGGMGEKSTGEKSAQDTKQDTKGGDRSKGMSSQNEEKGSPKDMKAEGQERNGAMKPEDRNRAEGRDDRNNGNANKAEGRDNAAGAREDRTVGQAGAGAKMTTEQRTRVTTVIRDQHVSPVTSVNFSISVGTRVPREVGFHPLPTEIVTVYPDWRGYEFFLVRDQIVVVDPRSLEIIAVLDA
jgi:Protein of unknown function (DUF1236)